MVLLRSVAMLIMSAPVKHSRYNGDVFRAFSTAHPPQELMDDLLDDPKEREALKPLYYADETPADMDRLERVLKRSAQEIIQQEISAKFQPQTWNATRFSNGSWAVLYSAEAKETALHESLYHKRRFMAEEIAQGPVQLDLKIVRLSLQSNACGDLTKDNQLDQSKLTSQDESGYPYCQRIAKHYKEQGSEMLRSYSARHPGGFCTPIFDRQIIKQDHGHLEYVKCILSAKDTEIFRP